MLIFPLALGGGVVAGYAGGGRLRGLALVKLRAHLLLLGALATQVGLPVVARELRNPLVALSYAMVGVWLVVNMASRTKLLRVAIGLLALGWAMNVAAIAANGVMPVSLEAVGAVVGSPVEELPDGYIDKHTAAGPGTKLEILTDVIAVPSLRTVISVGDVVMVVGIVLTMAAAMASARPVRVRRLPREEAL